MLEILHQRKLSLSPAAPGAAPSEHLFKIDTCQRTLWIQAEGTGPSLRASYRGVEAYLFLLRIATGLESEVRGETDVFGQIKESWRLYCERWPEHSIQLRSWMNRLFEDAKSVRTEHLQGSGGDSYGTLTRKLLRSGGELEAGDTILVVGGGALTRSVLPHLSSLAKGAAGFGARVTTWTRSTRSEAELLDELARARHAVFCIPEDSALDPARAAAWSAGAGRGDRGKLLHLGLTSLAARGGAWESCAGFHALDSLFAFRDPDARDQRLERAARACEERARLRFLSASAGAPLSLPHGWEDLLAFS